MRRPRAATLSFLAGLSIASFDAFARFSAMAECVSSHARRRGGASAEDQPGGDRMIPKSALTVLSSIALAIAIGLPASPAMAACESWQLLRKFSAVQENGYTVVFELDDVGVGSTSGRASYYGNDGLVQGSALATFDGIGLSVQVTWQDDTLGQYDGYIESDGGLAGFTRNLSVPGSPDVRWRSKQFFPCAVEAGLPTEPPGVLDRSGVLARPGGAVDILQDQQSAGLAGVWDTVTSSGGQFTLMLTSDGNRVMGTFAHADASNDGTLEGSLNDAQNQLTFTFTQPQLGVTGQGTFSLVARNSIDGRFTINEGPGNVSLWSGTRRQ